MIEGPGHVPFDQIEYNMKLQRRLCHGAPVLRARAAGDRHLPRLRPHHELRIGATAAAYHGASMLCYVTPKEHLGLPKKDDVKQGCASRTRSRPTPRTSRSGSPGTRDRDDELTKARAALNWEKHFELSFDPDTARAYHDEDLDVDTDFCAMCGHDWCSVRISKEIVEFVSGKDEAYAWEQPKVSAALTAEQREILEKRGVLEPAEIHRLARKTRERMAGSGEGERAACHSDVASSDEAHRLQIEQLDPAGEQPTV